MAIDNYKLKKKTNSKLVCSSLYYLTNNINEIKSRSRGKLVTDSKGNVLYCSRNIIPSSKKECIISNFNYKIHVGIFVFDCSYLLNMYKKENTEFDSKWIKMKSNNKIRNICYDINSGKLIGISSYDGQIYESRSSSGGEYVRWIGPINYDKPMKKIMFDREGIMIGIGLIDNFIYKKIGKNWRYEEWDEKNINKTKVYDIFFDKDGCMIASTPNGVKKQTHQDFNSEFIDIREYKEKHEDLMNSVEIIKSRVGIEFIDDEFDTNTELGRDLKRIYEFKKVSKDLCRNRIPLKKHSIEDNKVDLLSKQNREINDLYNTIDDISSKMNY